MTAKRSAEGLIKALHRRRHGDGPFPVRRGVRVPASWFKLMRAANSGSLECPVKRLSKHVAAHLRPDPVQRTAQPEGRERDPTLKHRLKTDPDIRFRRSWPTPAAASESAGAWARRSRIGSGSTRRVPGRERPDRGLDRRRVRARLEQWTAASDLRRSYELRAEAAGAEAHRRRPAAGATHSRPSGCQSGGSVPPAHGWLGSRPPTVPRSR